MRSFSFSLLFSLSLLVILNNAQTLTCRYGVLRRRSWRDMPAADRKKYVKDFATGFKFARGADSIADQFSKIHYNYASIIHGYPLFFPWHRYFLVNLEQTIQAKINGPFSIPYWNWVKNQRLSTTDVWGPDYFGNSTGTVNVSPFANAYMNVPSGHNLRRSLSTRAGADVAGASQETINSFITGISSYDSFRIAVEGSPHGSVHVTVSGDLGQMYSPNDPLFYSHHATVDKIWWNWQARGNNARSYGGSQLDFNTRQTKTATIEDVLTPYTNWKVKDVFDTTKLCYTYVEQSFVERRANDDEDDLSKIFTVKPAPSSRGLFAAPGGSNYTTTKTPTTAVYAIDDPNLTKIEASELFLLDVPAKLPDSWIKLNNLDAEAVRAGESVTEDLVKQVNSVAGYVSPSALWYSENAIANLLKQGKRVFKATVNQGVVVVTLPQSYAATDASVNEMKQALLKAFGVKGIEGGRRKQQTKIDDVVKTCGQRYHRAYGGSRK